MNTFRSLIEVTNWECLDVSSFRVPEEVPAALESLMAADETTRANAIWSLEDAVVRQSDLHESAYYVVAPLLAILSESLTLNRIGVYNLLFEIANGFGPPSKMLTTREGDQLSLRAACRREVRKGTTIFETDRDSGDAKIRATLCDLYESLVRLSHSMPA